MNTSGEAADQVVRMTLNGVEVAAKLSGAAAKQVAVMLYIFQIRKASKLQKVWYSISAADRRLRWWTLMALPAILD